MKRAVSVFLSAVLTLGLLFGAGLPASDGSAAASAKSLPNFIGIDDERIFDLSERYAPIDDSYGTYYVPHFALIDSELGVQWSWSQQQRYLTFRWGGKTITFELGSYTAFDGDGVTWHVTAYGISHAGVMHYYVNLPFICDFFGWTFTDTRVDEYGNRLFRIISNDELAEAGLLYRWKRADELDRLYKKYMTALDVGTSPEPPVPVTGSPSATPQPSLPSFPSSPPTPSTSPVPELPDSTPLPLPPLGVFITFDGALSPVAEEILNTLDRYSVNEYGYIRATFFLEPDSLADYPALARRMTARHAVGLMLDEPGDGGYTAQAETACALLDRVTLRVTKLVRIPSPEESAFAANILENDGYRLWGWTLDATGLPAGELTDYVLSRLPETGPMVLRLGLDEDTLQALPTLLSELSREATYFLRVVDIIDRPVAAVAD